MMDLDVKCRRCGKPMTLRVWGEQTRRLFQKEGALCQVCYGLRRPVAPAPPSPATPTPPAASANGSSAPRPFSSRQDDPGSA